MSPLKIESAWTGGQYSLFRVTLGLYLITHFIQLLPWGTEMFSNQGVLPDSSLSPLISLSPNMLGIWDSPLVVTILLTSGLVCGVLFTIGYHDRVAALFLGYIWACLLGRNPLIANPSIPYVGWLFLAHALLPRAPYGSMEARNRPDPGNNWKMPAEIYTAAWIVMALSYTYSGYTKLVSPSWVDGTAFSFVLQNPLARPNIIRDILLGMPDFVLQLATWSALLAELSFAPLAIFKKLRPYIWLGMVSMHIGLLTIISFADLSLGMLMMHLFTFNPVWIPGQKNESDDTLFYDGNCGLCHNTVRFLLAEDNEKLFKFAPLQGQTFQLIPEPTRKTLPDSLVVSRKNGPILTRSTAVFHLMKRLGGFWRLIAEIGSLIPVPVRDTAYDNIAKIRYKLFPKPADLCPIIPAHLRKQFLA